MIRRKTPLGKDRKDVNKKSIPEIRIEPVNSQEFGSDAGHAARPFEKLFSEEKSELQRHLSRNSIFNGKITWPDLLRLPEVNRNPLTYRIFKVLDPKGVGFVTFNALVDKLSCFSLLHEPEGKLAAFGLVFEIFDMDGDGYISNGELFQVLTLLTSNLLDSVKIQQLVDKTMLYNDYDNDRKISLEDFLEAVKIIGYDRTLLIKNL